MLMEMEKIEPRKLMGIQKMESRMLMEPWSHGAKDGDGDGNTEDGADDVTCLLGSNTTFFVF